MTKTSELAHLFRALKAPAAARATPKHLGQLDFLHAKDNVVLLGPPGTGKTHLAVALGIRACLAGQRSRLRPRLNGSPASQTPSAKAT